MACNHEHHLQYHSHKGVTGEYIGQLVDIPEVIVHAPTKEGIKILLLEALEVYFDAFPTEHARIDRELSADKPTIDEIVVRR
ncbi:MAG: hypothetical protein WCF23_01225 [Candidatus Nitrosopolaris sp.]